MLSTDKKNFLALCLLFAILGMFFSSMISRLPAIRDFSLLTTATLSLVLFLRGVGAVIIFPFTAGFITKLGAKKVALISGFGMILSLPIMAVMPEYFSLGFILFLSGAIASSFDISINNLGSQFEKRTLLSKMAFMHAYFSIGSVFGALGGGIAERFSISSFSHFMLIALILSLLLWFSISNIIESDTIDKAKAFKFVWPHGGLLVLGLIGFFASVTEGSIQSWITFFYSDHLKVIPSLIPLGFGAYSFFMLGGRLVADKIKTKIGASKTLFFGGLLATGGILLASFSSNIWISTIGFAVAGFGLSAVFPFLFSSASREGALPLASVATLGYIGGIAAPPVMGFLVETLNLSYAIGFLSIVTFTIALLANKSKLLKQK